MHYFRQTTRGKIKNEKSDTFIRTSSFEKKKKKTLYDASNSVW